MLPVAFQLSCLRTARRKGSEYIRQAPCRSQSNKDQRLRSLALPKEKPTFTFSFGKEFSHNDLT